MIEDAIVAYVAALRPWWWWLMPWSYALGLEARLRIVIQLLEDERATVVKYSYDV